MSTAYIGFGTELSYATTAGGSYTAVAQVADITGPSITVPGVKITNNDSTNSAQEKICGLLDAGKMTVKLIYLKTETATLYGLIRANRFWKIAFPDSSTWVCEGFITSFPTALPQEDVITHEIEIELTGKPTWTSG